MNLFIDKTLSSVTVKLRWLKLILRIITWPVHLELRVFQCAWNPQGTACTFTYTFDQILVFLWLFSLLLFIAVCKKRKSSSSVCLMVRSADVFFFSLSSCFLLSLVSRQRGFTHLLFQFFQLHPTSLASSGCQPFRLLTKPFHVFVIITHSKIHRRKQFGI